jgi:hypothetical protein
MLKLTGREEVIRRNSRREYLLLGQRRDDQIPEDSREVQLKSLISGRPKEAYLPDRYLPTPNLGNQSL